MNNLISKENIDKITKLLKKEEAIICAYLFGSRLKGKEIKSSDLDIAAVCFDKSDVDIRKLMAEVQKIFPKVETDFSLADLESEPIFLIQIINGRVIYEKSTTDRASLESKIILKYEDTRRFRNIRNYYLDKSFKEGIYAN